MRFETDITDLTALPECDLFIAADGVTRVSDSVMRSWAARAGQEITYTAATPGSGPRLLRD